MAKPLSTPDLSRRGFLGTTLAAVTALGLEARESVPQTKAEPAKVRIKAHRTLGRTGFKVSDIAFGAGNLTNANVLGLALDRGVNYIDTAESYGRGASERTIGEALKGRDRKSLFITTKLWLGSKGPKDKEALKARFRKCLERMGTEYADCLMIHLCSLEDLKHEPFHEAVRELKAEGRLRFSGLSNHGADFALQSVPYDEPMDKVIAAAAEDGRFDVALLVYNYLKQDMGARALAACKAKNMGVTLMKMDPAVYTQGDREAAAKLVERHKKEGKEVPEAVQQLIKLAEERAQATQAFLKKYGLKGPEQSRDAAIKFCLDHPDVACVCPSMDNFELVEAFVALSGQRTQARERAMLGAYAEACNPLYCRHACGLCEGACPSGVPVNTIMRYDYYFNAKGQEKLALGDYRRLGARDASPCAACPGHCQTACPFGVAIQGRLILAHQTLTLP